MLLVFGAWMPTLEEESFTFPRGSFWCTEAPDYAPQTRSSFLKHACARLISYFTKLSIKVLPKQEPYTCSQNTGARSPNLNVSRH